jgi:CO/xanthine dehydrogenase Mo-binding subunit
MTDPAVTGATRYSVDVELPGMLHGRLIRSIVPHGRVLGVDASAVPVDVVALTPDDVRGLASYGAQLADETVLALDRVRFVGDPVAAVAAETVDGARDAAWLVDVELDELPAVFDAESACATGAPLVHEQLDVSDNPASYFGLRPKPGTNICHVFSIRHGDVERGFAEADVVVEGVFRTAGAQQVPMEPHAALARWQDGRLEVWTGTQTPFNVRSDLARIFGLPEEQVRVVVPPMGGSFGAKTFTKLEAIAAALALKAGRPVKIVLDHHEAWLTNGRHPSVVRIRLGASRDGMLMAKEVEAWVDTGAYADCGPGVAQKLGFSVPGPYRIANVKVDARCVYTNLPPNGAFRGYGAMQAVWASERCMDRLADALGLDPLELRLQNVLRDGDAYCTGEVMHDMRIEECLRAAAEAVAWSSGHTGKGIAAVLKGMQTPSRAAVAIEPQPDGSFVLRCATTEMGQGARRALTRLAAAELGVEEASVHFPDPDTDLAPYDTRTTSSRSTYMMGHAIADAVRALRQGAEVGVGEIVNEGGLDPHTGQGVASTHWHQGAAAATVEVDEETGRYEIRQLHVPVYAGQVVERSSAELQNEGSVIMGLGTTMFESVSIADGRIANANLSDYQVPAFADVPPFTHELREHDGADVHGLGETALPPVPAAVGNALASLGIELDELPLTSEAVLDAVERRGEKTTRREAGNEGTP